MSKHALHADSEPRQKAQSKRRADRDKASQATVLREAIAQHVKRNDSATQQEPAEQLWARVFDGVKEETPPVSDQAAVDEATAKPSMLRRIRLARAARKRS